MWTKSHITQPRKPETRTPWKLTIGAAPRDGGHAAEVAVLERLRLLAVEPPPDRLRRVDPRLHRDLGDAREVVEVHHVADGEDLRVARAASSPDATLIRPARSSSAPAALGQHLRERRGRDAGGPDLRPRRVPLDRAVRALDVDAVGVDAGDDRSGVHLDARPARASLVALPDSRSPKDARISLPPSNRTHPHVAGLEAAEVAASAPGARARRSARRSRPRSGRRRPRRRSATRRRAPGRPRARPSRRRRRSARAARARRRASSSPAPTGRTRRGRSRTARRRRPRPGCRTAACRAARPAARRRPSSRRGRSRRPRRARRSRSPASAARRASERRPRRARGCRSRPGRAAAGRGGGSCGRRASPRPAPA